LRYSFEKGQKKNKKDGEEAEEAETGLFRSEVAATADEWNAVKCPELEVFELKELPDWSSGVGRGSPIT
jgi:hypothetical protein